MPPESKPIVHRNLPLLLLQARESVFAHFRPILNEHGVTEQQWRILRAVQEAGPLEPRHLCRICCLSSPSLAGVLARMDDLGLVSRQRLDHDQRRLLVSLTSKSKALCRKMAPEIDAMYQTLEAKIGTEFTERFYATLDELIETLAPVEDDLSQPSE
ncbi:MAG: MarR family transcriptional regulator [Rhizobacter sp.]|nr:MarR family transcriptional regulator [Rhizobacter sp.]